MKFNLPPFFYCLIILFLLLNNGFSQVGIIPFVTGIDQPIDLKHCGDDRLFVADRAGTIRVINADGTLRATPFLDITAKISSATFAEEGFLGFAFSPGYKTDGKLYVNYTANISSQLTTVIEEYKVSVADSNAADISSALTILTQPQPFFTHKGGNMMFGRDGFLYINLGDGGGGGDPMDNGQNTTTFLGKILRIDIRNSSPAQPYTVPPGNPFYNDTTPGIKKEIWAYGLRNPWRNSFDRITGDLWIADVGEANREEINFQAGNSTGGGNYGWSIMEGTSCYKPPAGCSSTGLLLPLYDYSHSIGQAITGGYVYRSAQSKTLFGMYIFADYVQKWIDGLKVNSGVPAVTTLITTAASTGNPISFGEGRYGDQYILFFGDNTVYTISDTTSARKPKAYYTITSQNSGSSYLLQGLQGRDLTYQWLKNNAPVPNATSPDYTVNAAGTYTLKVTNVLNISDTSDVFVFGVLPVSLVNFSARQQNDHTVQLQWQTVSEQNSIEFVVQRSLSEDAAFNDIAVVPGKAVNGNSAIVLNYTYIDSNAPSKQPLFYRLQIKNRDGSFYYSDIRMVNNNSPGRGFNVYPNPANGQAIIYLDKFTSPQQMNIFDELGKRVSAQQLKSQVNTIQLNGLKGIYILEVTGNNGEYIQRKKLVVL